MSEDNAKADAGSAAKSERARTYTRLRHKAMDLLARREHSYEELLHKLQERFTTEEEIALIDQVLLDLCADNLLSDERFTESYVRQRVRKGFGLRKIEAELAQRGVESALIRAELQQSGIDWSRLAAEQLQRKFGHCVPESAAQQQRCYRFLAQRGFDSEHIRAAMKPDFDE